VKPTDLRCEQLPSPLGIDTACPRFSWIFESDTNAKDEKQIAYRIRVFREQPNDERDAIWDSGKVLSSQMAQIAYDGPPLESMTRYVWRLRTWDALGESRDATATFETGLFDPTAWGAKWIARTTDVSAREAPMLRRSFTLSAKPKRARVYICGLGYYELSINGKKIGDHHLDPGPTRYDRRATYVTHDVTSYLRAGRNTLGVVLGHGWHNMQPKAVWNFHEAPWRAAPKLLLKLRMRTAEGGAIDIVSDESWKTSTGPITSNGMYSGEAYDARLEKPGWDTPGYDDSEWESAEIVPSVAGQLAAQTMPPVRICETLEPVAITEPTPGVFVFDMGQNFSGHAQLAVRGPRGSRVTLRYGERLHTDGTVDQALIARHALKLDPTQSFQIDSYILKGGAEETWEARFAYHGFRYVEMTGFPGAPSASSLRGRFVHSDVRSVGEFTCSNSTANKIQQNARWSYLSNLHGVPTDCPHREKLGWTGDAHVAAEMGLYNFDSASVYQKWMRDLTDEQRKTGELPGIVPTAGWGYDWGNGPAWDSALCLIPHYLFAYGADERALAEHYDAMRRYVDYVSSRANGSIVDFGLGDWVSPGTKTPVALTSTAYYYTDARIVAEAALLLGKSEDAKTYQELAQRIRAAFHTEFYDSGRGVYANGGLTAMSAALYHGLCPDQERTRVVANLVREVAKQRYQMDCGVLGAKYLLNVLLDNGHAEDAFRLVTQKEYPGYGWQI